jgi:hypothetical protein
MKPVTMLDSCLLSWLPADSMHAQMWAHSLAVQASYVKMQKGLLRGLQHCIAAMLWWLQNFPHRFRAQRCAIVSSFHFEIQHALSIRFLWSQTTCCH